MGYLFYDKVKDKAFRVDSQHFGSTWYKEVSTHEGRAKMNAERKFMATSELTKQIESGQVVKLRTATTIRQDINLIRAGKPIQDTKKTNNKASKDFKFYVGSLIDPNPSDYIAVCNQQGEITGHLYNGTMFNQEKHEEEKEEPKNLNQLNLF